MEGHDDKLTGVSVHDSIIDTTLRDACNHGNLDVIKGILGERSGAQALELLRSDNGCTGTPLFEAVIAEQLEVVQYLLQYGLDLEKECSINMFYPLFFKDTCPVLCVACAVGNLNIVQLLLQSGTSINHNGHSASPLMYACCNNNSTLTALLLQHGADPLFKPACTISKSSQATNMKSSCLPLYQTCLDCYSEVAELLLDHCSDIISNEEKANHLKLLGAECITSEQDYVKGVKYWKEAVQYVDKSTEGPKDSPRLNDKVARMSFEHANQRPECALCDVFEGLNVIETVADIEKIENSENSLNIQALLIHETLLGPSHPQTVQQISQLARNALEQGDLNGACRLFYHTVATNEYLNHTMIAIDYSSQLADLLLHLYLQTPDALREIQDIIDILLGLLHLVHVGMVKAIAKLPDMVSAVQYLLKYDSVTKMLMEQIETFMAYLRLLVDLEMSPKQRQQLKEIVYMTITLKHPTGANRGKLQSILFKIACYKGQCTQSTLYFFQEDFFPHIPTLKLLISCGGDVNVQDVQGDTPLHYATDCVEPDREVVLTLLGHQAHLDTCNKLGQTPYHSLQRASSTGIQPFKYISLKCHAAKVIMTFSIPYVGQVPKSLENFIPRHGIPKAERTASCSSLKGMA